MAEYAHTAENCPQRGKLKFPHDSDVEHVGRDWDHGSFYCRLCGVKIRRFPYPEEALQHPPQNA